MIDTTTIATHLNLWQFQLEFDSCWSIFSQEPDEKDWTQRAQRVEEELQKTRVMFFHSRG